MTLSRVKKKKALALLLIALGVGVAAATHGLALDGSPRVLSATEAKHLLSALPYKYEWRNVEPPEGASGALAGTVSGRHHTVVQFGISLGKHAPPVPVPKAGVVVVTGAPAIDFTFTDDLIVEIGKHEFRAGPSLHNDKQERIANEMTTDMEEALCLAATGEHCGI